MFSTKMMRQVVAGGYSPNAVKFDGANDYLAKSTKLTGAADASTGILSFWIRFDSGDTAASPYVFNIKDATDSATVLTVYMNAGKVAFSIRNNGATIIVTFNTSALVNGAANTGGSAKWFHILSSWDMNYSAGNKLKNLYVNDVSDLKDVVDSGAAFSVPYSTVAAHYSVGAATAGGNKFNGSISELYFAPGQYLDFSVESNRRKFIDADGLPVSLGADGSTPTGVAPIVYLKGDYTAFGVNSGTGGDFTLTGALQEASTTPATASVEAVKFDGSADYLTRGGDLTGLADGKSGVLSFWLRLDGDPNSTSIIRSDATAGRFYCILGGTAGVLRVYGANAANTQILNIPVTAANYVQAASQWRHCLFSWDLAAGATHLYINDVDCRDAAAVVATNDTIDYVSATPNWAVAATTAGNTKLNGALSELYFAPNQYLDLSVQANREKFIKDGKPVSLGANGELPTGTAPAIYLPNRAALVGTNAGTGGNFTVNGAPKDANSTPLYYYAEPATFDGTNDSLARGAALTGIADGKTATLSMWFRVAGTAGTQVWTGTGISTSGGILVSTAGSVLTVLARNSSGTTAFRVDTAAAYGVSPIWHHLLFAYDLANTTGYCYIDNVSVAVGTVANLTVAYLPDWFASSATNKCNGDIADLWFTTTYLDISQAANRAKFIDQTTLRPVPLGATGELPTGTAPLVYLGRDYTNFHTNLGSGGAFTVTGALTRGTTSPSDVTA